MAQPGASGPGKDGPQGLSPPVIALPKGGGAIRGIGEKFGANPATGTGSLTIPIAVSPGRSGFGPELSLSYDSGSGNGPFGFGWSLSLPTIARRTDKGLPRYRDGEESDVFILSGSEDLVPALTDEGVRFEESVSVGGETFTVHRYRPRVEGLFGRIERWTRQRDGDVHWRSTSRDNVLTLYGLDVSARIADPGDARRILSWLISETRDDRGNAIVYEYRAEDSQGVDTSLAHERNRSDETRSAQRYLKRVFYGNRSPLLDGQGLRPLLLTDGMRKTAAWLFEVVFDYGEHHLEDVPLDQNRPEAEQHRYALAAESPGHLWAVRPDPFSSYRAAFEVRTYRRCHRVLMFHQFDELGPGPYLVRSTDFDYADLDYSRSPGVEAELTYAGSTRIASFIHAVIQSGYVRDDSRSAVVRGGVSYRTYLRKSLPPLELAYTKAVIDERVHELDASSMQNLPAGLEGRSEQWVDLDGEGVPGFLAEQADAWFYKSNLGAGRFAPLQTVARRPSLAAIGNAGQQLLDLAGDGRLDLVDFASPTPGYYERNAGETWDNFRPVESLPNVRWDDPNLRFVDLTGDALADILITESEALIWYPLLGESQGFGTGERVPLAPDEEKGPRVLLADGTRTVQLADLSGDGLADLVRIRNGEICYWPNLGYGRFGPRVTMDNAPRFDAADQFDATRLRLADVDGSGTTDVIYLQGDAAHLYFNQSGNRWSDARPIRSLPAADNVTSVVAIDLLGNGTACLVWSSPLPGADRRPLRYIDLMGGQKPHLLVRVANNLGAETRVEYAPSTKFYLADKGAGRPWITRLPFPVHVVERVETYDRVSRNRFVTRYAYHHGFFDGKEREFRGFGLTERWDTEEFASLSPTGAFPAGDNIDRTSHVPPVYTKTWFHTGVYLDREHVSDFFATALAGYYREPGLTDLKARALLLPDTVLPEGLTADEEREACRALKGRMLRQEIFGLDGSAKDADPYAVTEQNFTIRMEQSIGPNRHAVFLTHAREAISYHYERNPADPRIAHQLTLEVDDFGDVLKEASVSYGRRKPDLALLPADQDKQSQIHVTYTEGRVTNAVDTQAAYRTPLPCETCTYELTGYGPTGSAGRFQPADFVKPDPSDLQGQRQIHVFDTQIPYEASPTTGRQRRPIDHARTVYRKDDLTGLLPLGTVEPMALSGQAYRLAFTSGLLVRVFRRNGTPLLANASALLSGTGADQGGYVDLDRNGDWWIPTGRVFLSPDGSNTFAQELTFARSHFLQPRRYVDPFQQTTSVAFDAYDLLLQESTDPVGNRITVGERDTKGNLTRSGIDYRVLQPSLVMDANRNRAGIAFDALGLVVGTAEQGKPEEKLGDSLDTFAADLTDAEVVDHFANPLAAPNTLLGRAATRLVHDLFAYQRTKGAADPQPAVVCTMARETHEADLKGNEQTKIQQGFAYSDGFGRVIQKKIRAEQGPAPQRGSDGKILVDSNGQPVLTASDVSPRWVGSGWTVFNNKGKPVRQYEPFFTDTHAFEFDVRIGRSPVLFYDPVERIVGKLHPNHTWEKLVFDAWRQETWDVSDTILITDPAVDADLGDFFKRLPNADYAPTWHSQRAGGALGTREQDAATKAALHAITPTIAQLDTLGRTFLTVVYNRFERNGTVEEHYPTRVELDIEGNRRAVRDAIVQNGDDLGRVVMRFDYDLLGRSIHHSSMEAGERWTLVDAIEKPIRGWDSRGQSWRTVHDALRRPASTYVQENVATEREVQKTTYGEAQGDGQNARGRIYKQFDQAGVVTNVAYDFKGNLLASQRQLAADYKHTLDWSQGPHLEKDIFGTQAEYDALNRPITASTPDKSVVRPSYNEANLLESLEVDLRGEQANGHALWTSFVNGIDYDAKGRRTRIDYANGATTKYEYDLVTSWLVRLQTNRGNDVLQDLSYVYDPVGNITSLRDDAQQTVYFKNAVVEPTYDYTYDAAYRLIEAGGREHLGQQGQAAPSSWSDASQIHLPHPGDGQAMGRYTERYDNDGVGNILQFAHQAASGSWTRSYFYNETSLLEAGKQSNRLSSTSVGQTSDSYAYDAHGNVTKMSHLPLMSWDFRDQLQATAQGMRKDGGTAETTWYVSDASGQRVRKVTDRQAAKGVTPTRMKERIYVSGFEVYREFGGDGTTVDLERETLHVMDDKQRVAMVESRTHGEDLAPARLIRYQLANHLGSSSVELDEKAQIISYEEYTPYGSTSYQAVRGQTDTPKRYRYTGKERDEESGLSYHGARYYAPWLGRWTTCDPIGIGVGLNVYAYVSCAPTASHDRTGFQDEQPWLMQQSQLTISPVATRTKRGITSQQRAALRGLDYGFGPGTGSHWGHPPGHSFATQPAGTRVTLMAEPKGENLEKSYVSSDEAAAARASGQFARVRDVDLTVPKGTRYQQPPPEAFEEALADYDAAVKGGRPVTFLPPEQQYQLSLPFETQARPDATTGVQIDLFGPQQTTSTATPANLQPTPTATKSVATTSQRPAVEIAAPDVKTTPKQPPESKPSGTTGSGGGKVAKTLGEGAEAGMLLIGLALEGKDEGSSAEALLTMAATAGGFRLLSMAAATRGGPVGMAGALGIGAGIVVEDAYPDYSKHAADVGTRVKNAFGNNTLGAVATVGTTLPLVWALTKGYDLLTGR